MIKGRLADIIVTIYLLGTLYLRIVVEHTLTNHTILSIAVGLMMLLFLWSLIKIKLLVPDYFGLLKPK